LISDFSVWDGFSIGFRMWFSVAPSLLRHFRPYDSSAVPNVTMQGNE
jgi:hypothetical protein